MGRKIFALVVTAIFIYITSPLIFPVAMGGVLAVLFVPLLERLKKKQISSRAASGLLTFGITLVVLIPMSFLLFFVAKTGLQQLQAFREAPKEASGTWVETLLNTPFMSHAIKFLTEWFPIQEQELIDGAQEILRSVGLKIAEILGGFFTQIPGIVMAIAVIVVSIYFFLADGKKLMAFVRKNTIFTAGQTNQLIHTIGGMCRSVILASVVSGAVQAAVETIFCIAIGIPNAGLIGVFVFLASFVPVIGSAPITFGVALIHLLSGSTAGGIVLLVGAVLIVVLDNLIRPAFLKGSSNLHPLVAFVAAFGGLQTLGFVGVFLGPIVAGIFIEMLEITVQA